MSNEEKKTATIEVTPAQAGMLLELVTKGAVNGPAAREFANLYDNVFAVAADLGVTPQG